MTGNNKFWRASLAGLASVAMLATMGVTALTASAATAANDYTVTLKNAPSGDIKIENVWAGDTIANALVTTSNYSKVSSFGTATKDGKFFVGFTATDGGSDFVDPLTVVDSDVTLYAKYETDVVTVKFDVKDAKEAFAYGDTVYVPKGSTLNAQQLPFDLADGKLVKDWKVTYADGTTDTKATADLKSVNVSRPATGSVKIERGKYEQNVRTVEFIAQDKTKDNYGVVNGALDGDASDPYGHSLKVDAVEGAKVASPTFVSHGAAEVPTAWQNYQSKDKFAAGAEVTVNDGKDGNNKYADADAAEYAVVKFDANGGTKVASQPITLNQKDAKGAYGYAKEPAAPTRDGYVFKGWKLASASDTADADTSNGGLIDFSKTEIRKDATFQAVWEVTTGTLKVTFKDYTYDGSQKDVTVEVKGADFLSADQAPAWERAGYVLKEWQYNGATFDFNDKVAAEVNGGNDFTLTAKWEKVTTDLVPDALSYIPATTEYAKEYKDDAGKIVTTKEEDVASYKADFTAESWKAYAATYETVLKEYKQAKFTAPASGVSAETSAKLVSELKAAWEQLVFAHDGGSEPAPVSTKLTSVHRLYSPSKNEHFYSNDRVEIAQLTDTESTSGNWNDEGVLFYTGSDARLASLPERLDDYATPILKSYARFYSPTTGDHVWTLVGGEEYKTLAADAAWNNEGVAYYTPTFTGSTDVVRFYNPGLNRHLLSVDPAEQAQLVKDGWNREGVSAKGI